jgi:hypothetical protein
VMPKNELWHDGALLDAIGSPHNWVVGNARNDRTASNLISGTLFPYLRSVPVFRCPSDRSTIRDLPGQLRFRSYQLNGALNGSGVFLLHSRNKVKALELHDGHPRPDRGTTQITNGQVPATIFRALYGALTLPNRASRLTSLRLGCRP